MLEPAGYTIRLLTRGAGRTACTRMHKYWHDSHTVQIFCTLRHKQHKPDMRLQRSDGHCCICAEGGIVVVADCRTPE